MTDDDQLRHQLSTLALRVGRLEEELAALRRSPAAPGPLAPAHTLPRPSSAADIPQNVQEPRSIPVHPDIPGPAARLTSAPARSSSPSLESRIGSQLFNRIGILALLVGAAWFLKFAIDQHWIGPLARVLIGVTCGMGLLAWSEWFRARNYKAFSYSLKALGTGILYLSLWAAYTLFSLIPSAVAFLAMVLVTVTNAWLSWRQNSEVLAFYAAIGGFLTPLLLWSAESQELTLFSYLLLLDLSVLALVTLRPWSRLLLAAFAGTVIYSVGWYVQHYTPDALGLTAFFVVIFFLLFSAAPQLLRNLRLANSAAALTFEDQLALLLLPLLNGLLAFAEIYALLSEPVSTHLRAWVAFAFSAFYLAMLRLARSPRLAGTPTRLSDTYLLLSVLAFTGALPLAFSGRAIAVGWSAECVLLFVLSLRLHSRTLLALALSLLGLAFAATLSFNTALTGDTRVLFNPRFGAYFVAVAAGVTVAVLSAKAIQQTSLIPELAGDWRRAGVIAAWGAVALLMIGVSLDIGTYWRGQHQIPPAERIIDEQFTYSAWTMLFGLTLLVAGFWRKLTTLRWQGLVLLTLSIAKVFLFDLRTLSQGYRILSFLALGILLVAVSFVYQRDLLGLRDTR